MLKEFNIDDYKYVVQDMPYEEFTRNMLPLQNDVTPTDLVNGWLLEHDNGPQWDKVRSSYVQSVWTVVEEDGALCLRNGLLLKNRRGYVLCERYHNARELLRVKLPADLNF